MALLDIDLSRTVIPRWRTSVKTMYLGELDSAIEPSPRKAPPEHFFTQKLEDWKSHQASLAVATDLIGSALALGRESEIPAAARTLLAENCEGSRTRTFLLAALSPSDALNIQLHDELGANEGHYQQIHQIRAYLHNYPRDAIMWVDMARLYELLAQRDQARAAIQTAYSLASDSRFVVRSAARLFIHQDEFDVAHELLINSKATPHDPWLMAAEIATAPSAGQLPFFYKRGKKLIASGRYSPFHVAELHSAIATDDLTAGKNRQARRGFEASLLRPTENTVAQARWAIGELPQLVIDEAAMANAPQSAEGDALTSHRLGDWDKSLRASWDWHRDQPFSSRPAAHGSFIGSITGRFQDAIEIARAGLVANPRNVLLLNNLSYSLAMSGHLDLAKREFARIPREEISEHEIAVCTATKGLLEFRSGNPEHGRILYKRSLDLIQGTDNIRTVAMALSNWALEELRVASQNAKALADRALEACKPIDAPDIKQMVTRVQQQMADRTE